MAREMFRHRGLIAAWNAIAADVVPLKMRRCYGKDISFPFSRGEALPRMPRVFGRMRPAIHPDGALHAPGVTANTNRGDLLSDGIFVGPDAHRKARAAEQIVGAVRDALAFGNGLRGSFPTV